MTFVRLNILTIDEEEKFIWKRIVLDLVVPCCYDAS